MTSHNFMIGPIKEGLRKDLKPYAIPEDSFETLTNAYQFRGRIVRRSGYTTLGRLSPNGVTFPGNPVMGLRTREIVGIPANTTQLVAFDTTTAYFFNGTVFNTLPSVMPVVWSGNNSQFFYTVNYAAAFWATNFVPGLNGWKVSLFAGSAGVGNAATVNVTSAGNNVQVGDHVYFINLSAVVAANDAILAIVTTAGNPFTVQATNLTVGSTFAWTNGATATGLVLDSMQTIAGQDGIRYYAPTAIGNTWVNYNPPIDPNTVLAGALLIFPYRGYLVFLNTWEGNDLDVFNFPNRARWTQIGTPYYSDPVPNSPSPQTVDILAVRDDIFGRGGANDAPTSQTIVGAGFIRDILVVYFENSTWRLRFVNNTQNPFVWERVNIEFGSDCTFSAIPFDKGLMGIGTRGIVISDANDTIRFDEKIPDEIFKIRQANNGLERVYGIRTFESRLVYWTFPSVINPSGIFPDLVLVFNYDTKNWSFFDDCFTCFGYYYPGGTGKTWNDLTEPWQSYNDLTWDAGASQQGYENIIAGNQQGYVLQLEQTDGANGNSLFISNLTGNVVTSPNNNLPDGSWITLSGITGITFSDGVSLNGRNFKVSNPNLNANDFILNEFDPILGPNASGSIFNYTIGYLPLLAGSIQINIGSLVYTDKDSDGLLYEASSPLVSSGSVDYNIGTVIINFSSPIASIPVFIRVVSLDPTQTIDPITTTGTYTGGGEIAKISNFDLQTKIFNFFNDDKRARLSKIDFYVNNTQNGQFTCNIFPDSSDVIANKPLPDNLQSNVVLTSVNPYQFGEGDQAIYRLYANVVAQTIQMQFTLSDAQMSVNSINSSDFEIVALMVTMRRGGRLV